ncbi:hypothetical protein LR48_Vigan11g061800 [Vigna angularis]|uniref:Uncharacterized protein n=1 Tax=Phaseolus angularis TaxID=3914 RepID=A0A0L9VR90_PHAAN|nr:hypothetical protein LR48_Vigan11g061800 [Vigna angularis]
MKLMNEVKRDRYGIRKGHKKCKRRETAAGRKAAAGKKSRCGEEKPLRGRSGHALLPLSGVTAKRLALSALAEGNQVSCEKVGWRSTPLEGARKRAYEVSGAQRPKWGNSGTLARLMMLRAPKKGNQAPYGPSSAFFPDAFNGLADSGGGTNQPSSPLTWTIEAPNNGRGASAMQRNGLKMTGENRKVSGMKQWFGEGETEAQFQTVVFCELGSEIEAEIWVLKCDADRWRCASNGA